jgi:nucleotide-binding universal stress UspA family protein
MNDPCFDAVTQRFVMDAFKSLLVHLDALPASTRRLGVARHLAVEHEARIDVLYAVMPLLMQYPYSLATMSPGAGWAATVDAEMRDRTKAAFELERAAAGTGDLAWQEALDNPLRALKARAWAADLLVLGQHDPQSPASGVLPDFAAAALVETGKPALVLPYIDVPPNFGQNVLVAWKRTAEAARAMTAALPILERARSVHVAAWDESNASDASVADGALEFLHRHGVQATIHRYPPAPGELGEALLSQAADLQADLLVMGCYGHGRAREWAMGGVTRTVFESMTLPVLMMH